MKVLRIIFVIICIILVLCISGCADKQQELTVDELISLGEKYLLDSNYEQALVQFKKVIEIEPMNPQGYTGAAEAYIGLEQLDEAVAVLQKGLEQTEDDEIRNMLDVLVLNDVEDSSELTAEKNEAITSAFNEYELSYFFEYVLPIESLSIGNIPFYEHTKDFEEESFREFGVQLSVEEDKIFAFIGDENFNEFAGLAIGMELNEALDTLGFTQEGISFIKEAQSKNSNTSISFNLFETENIVSVYASHSTPYDLDIIIYYGEVGNFNNLYLVIGFYDNHIALLEAHAITPN